MSKKLINSPVSAVDDALSGLVAVYPGLRLLENYRIIIRSDIDKVKAENKVMELINCNLIAVIISHIIYIYDYMHTT